jgi:hypothetical protein
MGRGLEDLLAGLGGVSIFPEKVLSQFSNNLIEPLKAVRVLESFESFSWYCDSCDREHEFLEIQENRYKVCSDDSTAVLQKASKTDFIYWQVNWQKLREQFCQQNVLAPFVEKTPPGTFPIGARTGQIVFIVLANTGHGLLQKAQHLKALYSEQDLLIINIEFCVLSSEQLAVLQNLKVHYFHLEKVMKGQWLLPLSSNEAKQASLLILDPAHLRITILGHSFTFPNNNTYLFRTASVLVAAKGGIVRHEDFANQYYQISISQRVGSISANSYVSKLNRLLKKELPEVLEDKTVFESIYAEGYRLHKDFLPSEILI